MYFLSHKTTEKFILDDKHFKCGHAIIFFHLKHLLVTLETIITGYKKIAHVPGKKTNTKIK